MKSITRSALSGAINNNTAFQELVELLEAVEGPGSRFYVNSVSGASSNTGTTWDDPMDTLDNAVNLCQASRGDVIIVAAGHSENLSADSAVDIDVAGVTVIGLGKGSARPTFTFDTDVAADFKLAANGTHIENLVFLGGVDALTGPIEVTGTDCTIRNCEYRDVTGQATDVIVTVNNADRLTIEGLRFIGAAAAGGASAIALIGADDCVIRDCQIYGNFSVSAIDCRTTASSRVLIHDCHIWTENAADICIKDTVTASTGQVGPNVFMVLQDDAANVTEAITAATFSVFDVGVHVVNAVDQKSLAINWTAVADA